MGPTVSLLSLINWWILSRGLPNFIPQDLHDHYPDLNETAFSLCSSQCLSNMPIGAIDSCRYTQALSEEGLPHCHRAGARIPYSVESLINSLDDLEFTKPTPVSQ